MTATQIQFRRGSAAQMTTFTGAPGEVVVDTTNNRVVVHDGATAGGFSAAKLLEVLSNLPLNLQLDASVSSNLLAVAIKAADTGNDPVAAHPVLIPFRDPTLANGDPVWLSLTTALSIDTNAVGASLGTQNSVPFRFWIVAFNNAGTVVLALINCSTASSSLPITALQIYPLDSSALQSTAAMSSAATSAGVFYTPNGTVLTTCPFCILGYLEYGSGLATAGSYASAPTKVQLFGPGIKKPGESLRTIVVGTSSITTTTSSTYQSTALSATFTPLSPVNLIRADIFANIFTQAQSIGGFASLFRGSTSTGIFVECFGSNSQVISAVGGCAYDAPYSAAALTYTWKVRNSDNASTIYFPYINSGSGATGAQCAFSEIQG